MTEYDKIKQDTGLTEQACSCHKCAGMCNTSPCLGTPQDILTIINNGFIYNLFMTGWAVGIMSGTTNDIIHMVQLEQLPSGSCIMFDSENGLCRLHEAGLKPTEGKLATCDIDHLKVLFFKQGKQQLSHAVANTWLDKINAKAIQLCMYATAKHSNNKSSGHSIVYNL